MQGPRDVMSFVCRYEDDSDSISNLTVLVNQTDKSSISSFGSPNQFLNEIKFLMGEQTFQGLLLVFGLRCLEDASWDMA